MPVPRYQPHYTLADYRQWEGDWELWNGIPVAMGPSPFGPHQKMLARLSQRFLNALDAAGCNECEVLVECDWVIDDDTVVRPDLSVACGAPVNRHIDHPPRLIVEVLSAATANKDRTAKRDLYAQQGVTYYFLADPDDSALEVTQLTASASYSALAPGNHVTLELHPKCHIPLAALTP
jgi:Uma2 family endonuclease